MAGLVRNATTPSRPPSILSKPKAHETPSNRTNELGGSASHASLEVVHSSRQILAHDVIGHASLEVVHSSRQILAHDVIGPEVKPPKSPALELYEFKKEADTAT